MAVAEHAGGAEPTGVRSRASRGALVLVFCVLALAIGALAGRSPSEAIAATAVLAFIPIVVTRFTLGVGIFIVSTFMGISGTSQKGIGLLVIFAAIALLMVQSGTPNFFADHRRLTMLLVGFLAWCVLGLTWATSTGDVLTALYRYLPNFLVFFVVYTAARGRRDLLALAVFFVIGAAIAAGDAILSPPPAAAYGGVARSGGIFGDPNYLAAVLVTGFAVSLALTRVRALTIFGRGAAAAAALLCLVGIVFSVSRGGLIALAVALFAALLVAGRWRVWIACAITGLMLLGAGYYFVVAPASVRDRLTSTADGGSGRTTIWRVGWREVQHNLVKGVGAGNFSVAGTKYVFEPGVINHNASGYQAYFIDTPTVAHNTYLEVLAEEGIPGSLLFALIVVVSLRCIHRAALRFRAGGDEEMELLCYGVFCGMLGFLAASFFLSEEYSKQLYLLLAMGPALLKVATDQLPVEATARRRPWLRLGVARLQPVRG